MSVNDQPKMVAKIRGSEQDRFAWHFFSSANVGRILVLAKLAIKD
jgi:hypothetical protein